MSVERQRDCRFVCAVLLYWTDGSNPVNYGSFYANKTSRGQPLPGSMQFVIRLQEMSFAVASGMASLADPQYKFRLE